MYGSKGYKENELRSTTLINTALSIQNSQNKLKLDFSNKNINHAEYCLACRVIYEYVSKISASIINIDFSKNNIEHKFNKHNSVSTSSYIFMVIEKIIEGMNQKEKFYITVNFKDTGITTYSVVDIINNMKKWYQNQNGYFVTIILSNGDIYLFPMIFKLFKCENCLTICT